jgi:hypothetical protein
LIDIAAALQLGPLGSVAMSGGVLIEEAGIVARFDVSMSIGDSSIGLAINGLLTFRMNTTGGNRFYPDNSDPANLVAPGVLVTIGASFDFDGFATASGTATIQIGTNPTFRLEATLTFTIGPLEFDATALLEIYDDGVYFNATVDFEMNVAVMSLDLNGSLTIDTRSPGYFRLALFGDLNVLSVIHVTGNVIIEVSGYEWSITLPAPGLSADLFGLLELKLYGFLNSKGHFDLTLTGNITLGDSSTGVSGGATIRVALDPENGINPKVGAYRPGRVSFLRWTWKIALRFRADRAVSARG